MKNNQGIEKVLHYLAKEIGERPVGTDANTQAVNFLEQSMQKAECPIQSVHFPAMRWRHGPSRLEVGNNTFPVFPSPFSEPFQGEAEIITASTSAALMKQDITGKILLLESPIADEPLMPKGFPFYFPDEHKELIQSLEEKAPAAIIAATGKHPIAGIDPYPLFEDGNFKIPSCCLRKKDIPKSLFDSEIGKLIIDSHPIPTDGRQIWAEKPGEKTSVAAVFGHMDTKYGTPGAMDNAGGVAVILEVLESLKNTPLPFELHVIPFNGEEYFGVPGQLAYLEYLQNTKKKVTLAVNIDGVGAAGGKGSFSFYNINDDEKTRILQTITDYPNLAAGSQWYEGDHSMFAFQGVPCIAVTSSDLKANVMNISHTEKDTTEKVDTATLQQAAEAIADILRTCS
ncbi:MAG: M28 family peptidase [Spirochaetia bacterium]